MINKAIYLLTSIILIALVTVSCQDQEIHKPVYLNNFNDLTTETGGSSYKGEITSFVTDSNEVGIKLKGNTNKLFVLQRNETTHNLNIDAKHGQIIYLKHAIVINTGNPNKIYYLGIKKNEEKRIRKKVKSKIDIYNVVLGYGLAQIDIENFDKYDFKTNRSIYYSLLKASVKTKNINLLLDDDCKSGGSNSTSCSTSGGPSGGCSVSCSGNSYACCNDEPKSCKCIEKDETIDP